MTKESNPFLTKQGWNQRKEHFSFWGLRICTYIIIAAAIFVFSNIFMKGIPTFFKDEAPYINTEFFTESPQILSVWKDEKGQEYSMTKNNYEQWIIAHPEKEINDLKNLTASGGGILGPLTGTFLLVLICMIIALFIGVSAAIYLNEYCGHGKIMSVIRLSILNLAGVPSIVFALFGLGVFCWLAPVITEVPKDNAAFVCGWLWTDSYLSFQGWGTSLLAGSCTLAIMVLPVIITACEESLRAVPKGFREASYALGATQWQTIRKSVLPFAIPGVLTASVLGITRVAGETAPIMLTATMSEKSTLPWEQVEGPWSFLTQSVQALPFHIYTLAKFPDSEHVKPMQYGSIAAFLILVMGFALLSMVLRNRLRNKLKW